MKPKALIFGALMTLAALAGAQDTFNFERKYVLNDADTYVFKMSFSLQAMAIDATVSSTQKVVKVYDNGDADIETTIKSVNVLMNGSEMKIPGGSATPKPTIMRMDKFGAPTGDAAAPKPQASAGGRQAIGGQEMTRYFNFGTLKSLKVGQATEINYTDPQDSGRTVKGTAALESLTDGVAKVVANVNVTGKDLKTPMTMHITSFMDVASSKVNKVEGTISGMSGGPMTIDNAQFSMVRQRA